MGKTKKVENKKTPGRPPWIPTQQTIKTVESLAARGLTEYQIAACLGICRDTLIEKKKEYVEFSDAIIRGTNKGIASVADSILKNAQNGNMTAAIFYLKCKGGWKETYATEISGKDGKPIEVIDVTKLSEDELRALAEGKSISGT